MSLFQYLPFLPFFKKGVQKSMKNWRIKKIDESYFLRCSYSLAKQVPEKTEENDKKRRIYLSDLLRHFMASKSRKQS